MTLIIVPTISLMLDQYRNAQQIIDIDKAIEITNFIGSGKYQGDFLEEWLKYRKIMDKNHCDLWFYKICSEIRWLPSRGRAISDCLYALDKNNYKEIV